MESPQFVPFSNDQKEGLVASEKYFENYEKLRLSCLNLSKSVGEKSLTQLVDKKEIFRMSVFDEGIVTIEFVDIYQWMSKDEPFTFKVVLNPKDENYLSGYPLVKVSSESDGGRFGIDTSSMVSLSPDRNFGIRRPSVVNSENDLIDAVESTYRIVRNRYLQENK